MKLSVLVLLNKNKEILLYRRENSGWEDGKYSAPSGNIEKDESPREAAKRELNEELGVNIKIEDLRLVHVEHSTSMVTFMFTIDKWEGEPKVLEPETMKDLNFYSLDNLPSPIAGNGENILMMIKDRIVYSER